MVVQLDVKEAFDHVEQSSVQSDETTKFEPFSMALIAATWDGSCMTAQCVRTR